MKMIFQEIFLPKNPVTNQSKMLNALFLEITADFNFEFYYRPSYRLPIVYVTSFQELYDMKLHQKYLMVVCVRIL